MNFAQAAQLARAFESVARVEALTAEMAELTARVDALESRRRTRKAKPAKIGAFGPEPETVSLIEDPPWPTV